MNRYQQMLEAILLPEGQEERLRATVRLAEPKKRRRQFHPWGRRRKLLLLAALALLLLVSAAAALETVRWEPAFLDIFDPASQEMPGAEGVFQDVRAVSVCGDVTLTVRQAIGDKENLYLLLDYTFSEDAALDMAAMDALYASPILLYKGRRIAWEEVEPLTSLEEAVRTFGFDSTSGLSIQTLEADEETRTLSILAECDLADWSPLARVLNAPVSLIAGPPMVKGENGEEDVPVTGQLAVVSFTPDFHVETVKGKARTEDGVVYEAEVSPLSLSVELKGKNLPGWEANNLLPKLQGLVALRFRDGRELTVSELEQPGGSSNGGSSLTRHDDGRVSGRISYNLVFESFLDPAEVEAVLVGEVEIPLR